MTTSVSLPSSSEMAQALQQVREEGGLAKAARHMGPSGRRFAANVEKMLTDLQVAIEEKAPDSEFQKIIEYGAEIGSNASPEGIGESLGAAEDAATATARRAAQFAMMLVRMPEFRQDLLDLVQLSQEFLDYNTSEEYDLSKTDVTKLPEKMKETADVASSTASSNAENFTDKLASGQSISETAKSAFDVVTSSITENVPDVVMEEAGKLVRDTAKTVKEGETVAGAVQKVGEERLEQLQEAFKNLKITDEHKKKLLCKFQEIIDHIRGNPEIQRAFGILINSFNDFLHHVQLAAQVAKYRAQQVSGIAQQPLPSMESKYASDVGKSKAELMLTNSKKLIENFAGGRSLDPFLESLRLLVEKINYDNELRGYVDKLVDVLKSPIKIAEGKAHEKSSVSGKDQTEAAGKEKSHGTVTERPEEKHKKSAKTDILPKTAISRSEKKSSKTEKSETEVVEETVEELKETRPDQEIIQVLNDLQVYVSNRYQDEIQSVLFEGQGIMRAIAEDQTLSSLSQDISSISRDLFYDEKTGRPRINVEIWPDVIQILPILADKLAYLPLPRIDSNDEEAHLILDHIFLKCSGILPDRVKISAEVVMEKSETESGVVAVGRNRAQVSLSGIQVSATDIAWMYRKKRGLITWADVGLMDMDIFGEGLNIDLVLDATVPVVEAETGQSKSTVSVRVLQSNVSISGFNVKLKETRHDLVYSLLQPYINRQIRIRLEEDVEKCRIGKVCNKGSKIVMENIDQISKEGETIQPINQTPNVRSASLPMLANSLNSTSTLEPPQPSPGTIRTRTISANSVLSDPLLSTSKTSDSFPNGNLQQPHLKNPTITSIQQDPLTKFRAPSQFTNSTNVSVGDEVRLESPVGSINSPEKDLKFSPQKRRTISSMSGVSVESSGTDWQLQNTDNEESWSVSNQQLLIPSKTNGKAEKLRAQELSASSPNTSLYREQKKFSKQFPELEKEVDSLHGIYSCALERDVLWQGKIYQTALHLAFYGKIFSKAAKVIIHFQDVYTIEKKSTAGMFPNAIRITTANTRYVFSSFLKRDSAFLDMIDAWKQVNPTAFENFKRAIDRKSELYDEDLLLSSSNPATMGTGKGILRKSTASAQNSPNTPLAASMLGDQVVVDDLEVSAYTDDDYSPMINVDVKNRKSTNSNLQQVTPTTNTDNSEANLLPKQNSNQLDALDPSSKGLNRSNTFSSSAKTFFKRMVTPTNTSADLDSGSPSTPYPKDETSEILLNVDSERNIVASPSPENVENSTTAVENEVPTTPSPLEQKETGGPPPNRPDDPSDCSCKPEEHPAALVLDETFNIDIRDLFLAIFADGGSGAVRGAHKRRETEPILFTNWETDNDGRWVTRELNYDVWFKAPMMAKQATPSIEKQNVIKQEELYYVVDAITKTPKVPYGDYFTVNNRYCLTHVAPGKSRLTIRATVDFIKKTMMKGTIESSAIEGITSYGRELSFVLREMEAKPDEQTIEKLTAHDAAMALNESSNTVEHNLEKFEPDTSARIEVKSSRSVLGLFVGIIVAVTIAIPWKVFKSLLMLIPGMGKLFVKETRYQTVLSPRQKKKSPRGVAPDGSAATSRRRNYIDPIDLRPDEDGDFLGIPKGVVLGIVGVVMFTVLFGFCFTIMNIRWMNNVEDRLQSALTKIQELQKEVVPSTPVYKGEETISGDVLYQRFVQESQRRIKRIQNSAGILDKKVEGVELQIGSLKWEVGEAIIDLAMVLISERDIEEKKKVETEK